MPTSADTSERRHSVLRTRLEWSVAEKRAIVAVTRLPGASVSAISRRHGAAQNLIYQWKLSPEICAEPGFLPVRVEALIAPTPAKPRAEAPRGSSMIEIELATGRKLQ